MPKTMREQLLDLKSAVENGDADAIKQATDLKARIEQADQANDLLKFMGDGAKSAAADKPARTLGEFAAKNLDLSAMRAGYSKSAGTAFAFKAATDPHGTVAMESVDQRVVDPVVRTLDVRNLFGAETISGNALKYFILGAREDNSAPAPGAVNEAAAKPQFHIVESSATATLQKIAGWFYETDELLEDNAFLKSALDARGLYELDARVEAYLLSTLLATSGLGADTYANGGNCSADDVFEAIMTIKSQSGLNADAIIMNPTDYQVIRLSKDGGQYYGGGCFYGPYGNGQVEIQPGLWGLKTIVTPNITAGTVLVGNFKQGASVITKAGEGARIEVVTGDHDDAIYNRVTVVVEERLALAVRRPAAFVKITEAAS